MKSIIEELKAINILQTRIDKKVWTVFHKYCDTYDIQFNDPNSWVVNWEYVTFVGTTGRRVGYREHMCISIPIGYFEDFKREVAEYEAHQRRIKERDEKQRIASERERELKELSRLEEKYYGTPRHIQN